MTGQPSCDLWGPGAPPSVERGARRTQQQQVTHAQSLPAAPRCSLRAACLRVPAWPEAFDGARPPLHPSKGRQVAFPDNPPAHVNLDSGHEHPPPSSATSPPNNTGMHSSPSVFLSSDLVESDSQKADAAPDTIRSPSTPCNAYSDHVFVARCRPGSRPSAFPLSNAIST